MRRRGRPSGLPGRVRPRGAASSPRGAARPGAPAFGKRGRRRRERRLPLSRTLEWTVPHANDDWSLPGGPAARRRRHGPRVRRLRSAAASPCRGEDAAPRPAGPARPGSPVAGGPHRRRHQPPARLPGVRRGRGRRGPLHRHGVPRGRIAGEPAAARRADAGRDRPHRAAHPRRAGGAAPEGPRPPRSQTVERVPHPARGEAARLRPHRARGRAGARVGDAADADRHRSRYAAVHGARAASAR